MTSEDGVKLVRCETDDMILFLRPEIVSALAVLLHLVDDDPDARLSMWLHPLMRVLDRKLVFEAGRRCAQ